jgi:formylmethanofuran dehydrogenase subunit E
MTSALSILLDKSASEHSHLCPRQVLGVRMGLAGLAKLELKAPVTPRKALIIIETPGCFADGIRAATGATVGHRTMRVHDLGKVAATFTDLKTGTSLRLAPKPGVRKKAILYATEEKRHYFAQLAGYQVMPDEELFTFQWVELVAPASQIMSHQNARAVCSRCGEEVINEREVVIEGAVLCQTCAYGGYYRPK